MASKFVAENEGSGFAIPDDDDELQKLFNFESEDSTEEDTSIYFNDLNAGLEEVSHDAATENQAFALDQSDPFENVSTPVDETIDDEIEYDTEHVEYEESQVEDFEVIEDDNTYTEENNYEEPYVEHEDESFTQEDESLQTSPVVESRWATSAPYEPPAHEEPIREEPQSRRDRRNAETQEQPSYAQQSEEAPVQHATGTRRINIPSESDKIQETDRIIRVLDTYRNLNSADIKDSVYALMTLDNEAPESEAQVVVKALNAEPLLFKTIKALRESKNTTPVERVFYILELENSVFYNLGEMAVIFTEHDPIDNNLSKIAFARELVEIIDSLEDNVMTVVSAAEQVLSAAFTEENEH